MNGSCERLLGSLPEGLSLAETRETVERLHIIRDTEKGDFILTILGFKVGTTITPPNDKSLLKITEETLQKLKMFYVFGKYGDWYVAKSQVEANRLHQVFEISIDEKEQGLMSGFPESAVENYVRTMQQIKAPGLTGEQILCILKENDGELLIPPEISSQPFCAFLDFRLSVTNWQEELKTVESWAEAIGNFDFKLYLRRVKWYDGIRSTAAIAFNQGSS